MGKLYHDGLSTKEYFNKKYPERVHFSKVLSNNLGGHYFKFKNKKDLKKAREIGQYNTSYYSGSGVIMKCVDCMDFQYFSPMEWHDFCRFKKQRFIIKMNHPRCRKTD